MTALKQFAVIVLSAAACVSACTGSDRAARLDLLEERIGALEAHAARINDNITAANALYRANILIRAYTETSTGYDISLSSGEILHITFGDQLESNAPIIGIGAGGQWIISTDGGETFSDIPGTHGPEAVDGKTPQVQVDSQGFWLLSLDGGKTWSRILDGNGDPISARDGKSVNGSYAFFSKVQYNSGKKILEFTLADGRILSVPVEKEASMDVSYYVPGDTWVYAGRETVFPVKMTGIDRAVWTEVPVGWEARLDPDKILVKAPAHGTAGVYTLRLATFSGESAVTPWSFTFRYDPDLLFRDDFYGDMLDERVWTRYKAGNIRSDWDRYQEGDPEHSYVKDGFLTLLATTYGDTYRTGAVTSKPKLFLEPPFRIDCSARFTRMGQGVWHALWATAKEGYIYGELDIMEKWNFGTQVQHTVHSFYTEKIDADFWDQPNFIRKDCLPGQFNTYSVELTSEALMFFLNGEEVFRYKNNLHTTDDPLYVQMPETQRPYHTMNYPYMDHIYQLNLDIALGGNGIGAIADEDLPGQFDIDWISVKRIHEL